MEDKLISAGMELAKMALTVAAGGIADSKFMQKRAKLIADKINPILYKMSKQISEQHDIDLCAARIHYKQALIALDDSIPLPGSNASLTSKNQTTFHRSWSYRKAIHAGNPVNFFEYFEPSPEPELPPEAVTLLNLSYESAIKAFLAKRNLSVGERIQAFQIAISCIGALDVHKPKLLLKRWLGLIADALFNDAEILLCIRAHMEFSRFERFIAAQHKKDLNCLFGLAGDIFSQLEQMKWKNRSEVESIEALIGTVIDCFKQPPNMKEKGQLRWVTKLLARCHLVSTTPLHLVNDYYASLYIKPIDESSDIVLMRIWRNEDHFDLQVITFDPDARPIYSKGFRIYDQRLNRYVDSPVHMARILAVEDYIAKFGLKYIMDHGLRAIPKRKDSADSRHKHGKTKKLAGAAGSSSASDMNDIDARDIVGMDDDDDYLALLAPDVWPLELHDLLDDIFDGNMLIDVWWHSEYRYTSVLVHYRYRLPTPQNAIYREAVFRTSEKYYCICIKDDICTQWKCVLVQKYHHADSYIQINKFAKTENEFKIAILDYVYDHLEIRTARKSDSEWHMSEPLVEIDGYDTYCFDERGQFWLAKGWGERIALVNVNTGELRELDRSGPDMPTGNPYEFTVFGNTAWFYRNDHIRKCQLLT